MISQVSTALLALLPNITLDGAPLFVDVLQYPPSDEHKFNGYPSASFFYLNTVSDYSTVQENRRDIEFNIWVYGVWASLPEAQQWPHMYRLVDAVLDALDNSSDLGIPDALVRPMPGEMRKVITEQGPGLMARIRVIVAVDTPGNSG